MKIIGRGLLASALFPYQDELDNVVVFASGVSNSNTRNPDEFEREYQLLVDTLRFCLKTAKRVVYFSSGGAIYGNYEGLRDESTPVLPSSPYGRHKLLCEALIRQSTLPYLILRLPNIVGERQNKNQLIPALIRQARQGKVTLYKNATRDLIDVDDFANILVELLRQGVSNETVVVASGYSISVEVIFSEIQSCLDLSPEVERIDKGDMQQFSIKKLRDLLENQLPFHAEYYQEVIKKYTPLISQRLP